MKEMTINTKVLVCTLDELSPADREVVDAARAATAPPSRPRGRRGGVSAPTYRFEWGRTPVFQARAGSRPPRLAQLCRNPQEYAPPPLRSETRRCISPQTARASGRCPRLPYKNFAPSSHLPSASVDLDILTRNIGCCIACKKADQLGVFSVRSGSAHKGESAFFRVIDIVIA